MSSQAATRNTNAFPAAGGEWGKHMSVRVPRGTSMEPIEFKVEAARLECPTAPGCEATRRSEATPSGGPKTARLFSFPRWLRPLVMSAADTFDLELTRAAEPLGRIGRRFLQNHCGADNHFRHFRSALTLLKAAPPRPTTPLRRKRLLGGSRNRRHCPRNRPRITRCPPRSPNRKSVRPSRSATPGLPYGD